jgi:hypothetical protein
MAKENGMGSRTSTENITSIVDHSDKVAPSELESESNF